MIHVSGACQHSLDTTSSYYLGADTTAFTQLLFSDVFVDFPDLKLIIPHGGGAVPYHWGRFRGIAQDRGLGDLGERVLGNTPMIKVRVRKGTHVFRLRVKDDKNAMSQAIVNLRVI